MGTPAARRSMPHHRVPERKEASPVFERLRSELNWMVRHRVTEAVDAVCAAFEDELTRLAQPTDPPYELFYGCCSRLTRFIDSNMGTTPGFVQEMDRLIFACHCGASGKAVRKAMTKDLQIRRRQKTAAKVEGDTEQPADPSSKTSIARKKTAAETAGDESGVSSDDSVGKPASVGMASRQWATRKRLSTRSHSAGVKRLKRSPKSGRDSRENDKKPEFFEQDVETEEKQREDVVELDVAKEEEKREDAVQDDTGKDETKREDIDKERVCNEEKQCRRARASPRKVRAAKLTLKRVKCVDRLDHATNSDDAGGNEGSETEAGQGPLIGDSVRQKQLCPAGPRRSRKWNLRSVSKAATQSRELSQKYEDGKEGSHFCKEIQAPDAEETVVNETGSVTGPTQEVGVGDGDGSKTEKSLIETSVSVETSIPEQAGIADDVKLLSAESPIDDVVATKTSCRVGVDGDEEDKTSNGSDIGPENESEVFATSDDNQKKDSHIGTVDNFDEQVQPFELAQTTGEPDSTGAVDNKIDGSSVADRTGHRTQSLDELQAHVQEDNSVAGEWFVPPEPHAEQYEPVSSVPTDVLDETASLEDQGAEDMNILDEPAVPGLCDAGMRPTNEASHFKCCLRKAVMFVDAVLCKPPPGKSCFRDCKTIRERQCIEGMPCSDEFCSNWHNAEAHTDRCKNPLCEFRNRILLREIKHQIANLDVDVQVLQSQWERKTLELITATSANSKQLNDDIKQLERSIGDAKEEMKPLRTKRKALLANLSAIGVMPEDDEADFFPDFDSHYK